MSVAGPGERREVGDAAGSRKHPPHVSENAKNAPVQEDIEGEGDAPVPPANASGDDKVSTDKMDRPIRDSSMYGRRPEEDKDWDPENGA